VTDDDDRRTTRRLATLLALVPSSTRDRLAAQLNVSEAEIDRLLAPLLRDGRVTTHPGRRGPHRYALAPPTAPGDLTKENHRP
jgi:hypothetical protein